MKGKATQPKRKATPLTLEHLESFARAIHKDYKDLGGKITRLDDKVVVLGRDVTGLKTGAKELREDVKNMNDMMASKTDVEDIVRRELSRSQEAKDIENLRTRMTRVEGKLGINERVA